MTRALGWLALCAVAATVGVAIASLGQTRLETKPAYGLAPEAPAGSGGAAPADRLARRAPARREPATREATTPRLITKGVTVQVLNATRSRRAAQRMVDRLVELGFHVLVVNQAATRYPKTTVLWSHRSGRRAATALAARFGWDVRHKPRNLSGSVTTHVVVGRDEA